MSYNHFPPPPDEPVPVVPRELKVKRTVPTPRKAPTVRSGKGSIFGRATIPSVYWANDDPTPVNNSVYTFYREGTPPPDEKGAAAAAAHARNRGLSLYDDERRGGACRRQRRCCGLRMGLFWALVALIIIVVLGVGVGVGVGVSMGRSANQADGGAARTSSATPTPTSSSSSDASHTALATATIPSSSAKTAIPESGSPTSPTVGRTSSASTAPSATATSGATAVCPEANNTIYSPEGSDKRFLRVCGIDYTGDAEAIDMSNMLAGSMGECIDICSKAAQCTGVAWGNTTSASGAAEQRCWLKRDMKKSHEATDRNWNFAILL
ncbi:hypothetical protein C8035_v009342 [Colletotrichum spinosum]|uniref:Apple domain-containing protein n=1 Tax=Colletotrichum spinosum TaxID=1347390 RepID=A0A4R8QH17_9PEZI|nr:hypothetical protein C8035_v009342 [Colletotrichum spinosum]